MRTCRDCAHLLRTGACHRPEEAGIFPPGHGFGIAWPPPGHAVTCRAFEARPKSEGAEGPIDGGNSSGPSQPLTEREKTRHAFRVELFQSHGWPEWRSQMWAWRLVDRDQDRDDRHLCVECDHLLSNWRCRKNEAVLAETLQRCPTFEWSKP